MIRLTLLSGAGGGSWETDLARVRVGRAPDAEVSLARQAGPVVSEHHALVEFRDDWYWLADAGSRNGTFLNGERVDTPRPLREGDVIRLGADAGPELQVAFVLDREQLAAWERARGRGGLRIALVVGVAALVVLALGLWLLLAG